MALVSSEGLLATVRAEFRTLTGREPEGLWRAPGRVNLIGEHTDYNDGFVFPLAIDLHVLIAASPRTDGVLRVRSVEKGEAVEVPDVRTLAPSPTWKGAWASYVAGTAWALRDAGYAVGGADIVVGSTLPAGAGLSSSAALECGTARALTELHGVAITDLDIAKLAQRAENVFVGMPCGLMDQLSSTFGRAGHALFIDCRKLDIVPYPFDVRSANLELLVIDTRAHHELVDGGYADRRAACERSAAKLGVPALRDVAIDDLPGALERLGDPILVKRTRHIVTENDRVNRIAALLDAGRVTEIGPLLTASHVSLRDDFQISCEELDVAVDTALASGALGARMVGGGFGGSAIALVPTEKAAALEQAVVAAFSARGFTRPWIFRAVAADGVHRVAS
ncbi:galactokinase [Pendulispora brunnea]|uniref:Galactokinase n=1 Tax=Pendulispora brunnea TaxID=2905690 RepID=A0ABZ2KQJ8_9BACT